LICSFHSGTPLTLSRVRHAGSHRVPGGVWPTLYFSYSQGVVFEKPGAVKPPPAPKTAAEADAEEAAAKLAASGGKAKAAAANANHAPVRNLKLKDMNKVMGGAEGGGAEEVRRALSCSCSRQSSAVSLHPLQLCGARSSPAPAPSYPHPPYLSPLPSSSKSSSLAPLSIRLSPPPRAPGISEGRDAG